MLIKIGISRHIKTKFYLTLDCDVFATKKMSFEDMVNNSNSNEHTENRLQVLTQGYTRQHRQNWWEDSAKILNVEISNQNFGVTPGNSK